METKTTATRGTFKINTQKEYFVIPINSILFCEASGSYSLIHCNNQKYLIAQNLARIEKSLSKFNFIRCHYSYLVNLKKVDRINKIKKELLIQGKIIPISRRRYSLVIKSISKL